jgi:hypothetical protein
MLHKWDRGEMHIGYWWESWKEGDCWEDQDVGRCKILKWILERKDGNRSIDWIDLAQDKGKWRFLVNMVMNLQVPLNAGKFLNSCTVSSFSRSAQLHK